MDCLRQKIEKTFPVDDLRSTEISLMGCAYCKKRQNKENVDKYLRLLIEPMLISQRRSKNSLMRAFGSTLLEETAELFEKTEDPEKDIESFQEDLIRVAKREVTLQVCVEKVEPYVFLKALARLYYSENYDLVFALSFVYTRTHIIIRGHGLRSIIYYGKDLFFDLGVSLDEGMTEHFALEVMKSSLESDSECSQDTGVTDLDYEDSHIYFTEVRFFRKLCKTIGVSTKEFFAQSFAGSAIEFLYKAMKDYNPCLFYELLKYTDEQNWKVANGILKKIKGENV